MENPAQFVNGAGMLIMLRSVFRSESETIPICGYTTILWLHPDHKCHEFTQSDTSENPHISLTKDWEMCGLAFFFLDKGLCI